MSLFARSDWSIPRPVHITMAIEVVLVSDWLMTMGSAYFRRVLSQVVAVVA